MNLQLISEELRVGACGNEDIPQYITSACAAEKVNVFYLYDCNWLVLNRDNKNYERNKDVIMTFLQLENQERQIANKYALQMGVTLLSFIINMLRLQRKMHKSKKPKIS